MKDFMKLIFIDLFPAYLCFFIIWCVFKIQSANENNKYNTRRNQAAEAKAYLAKKGKIKFFTYCKNNDYYGIVNNRLWICKDNRQHRIKLDNVIGTEMKYQVSEKSKMKVMTVVPTFDKQTRLVKFELILYSRVGSDTKLVFTPQIVDEQRIRKMQLLLNEMIEEGKSSNN